MDVFHLLFRFLIRLVIVLLTGGFLLVKWTFRGLGWGIGRAFARPADSHGSARFAKLRHLIWGRAWGGHHGVIVGKSWGRFIRFKKDGATLLYAPMGSGKGVGVVIPNLLDARGAVCVTDPKGENFAITARFRSALGPVIRLDAIHPAESDRFNPFSMVRRGTLHEADDVGAIAELLVTPESADSHWDTSAKQLLSALIRHVLHSYPEELQTLSMVRELIAADSERLKQLFQTMAASPIASVAEEARAALAGLDIPETKSVIRNTAKAMAFWSKDRIGGHLTSGSDFDFMDMYRGTISIFVMVPDDALDVYRPFMRLMMGCALTALMRGKNLPRPRHKPMLILDECAALGRLEVLEKAMGLLREYAHTLLIWQDLGQLRAIYGERARSFLANSGCQVTFGVSDLHTAKDLADTIGHTTVLSRSGGQSQTNTDLLRANMQQGFSESGRYLRDAAEIRRLPESRCLIFMQRQVRWPILAKKVRYYKEWRWRGRWDRWRAKPLPVLSPTNHQEAA